MLSGRCPVCPVLSVCDVGVLWQNGRTDQNGTYSMEVGLGPGHIVLVGDPAPLPKKGPEAPIFGPFVLWPNGWMDEDATWNEVDLGLWPHC